MAKKMNKPLLIDLLEDLESRTNEIQESIIEFQGKCDDVETSDIVSEIEFEMEDWRMKDINDNLRGINEIKEKLNNILEDMDEEKEPKLFGCLENVILETDGIKEGLKYPSFDDVDEIEDINIIGVDLDNLSETIKELRKVIK